MLLSAWVFALLEWQQIGYHWTTDPSSPHPEISLVTLEPRFGIGSRAEILTVGSAVLWKRPAGGAPLALFSAAGVAGEPAVRLTMAQDDREGDFTTIGYAVRHENGWEWLSPEGILALEAAAEERRAALAHPASVGRLGAVPLKDLPPKDVPLKE